MPGIALKQDALQFLVVGAPETVAEALQRRRPVRPKIGLSQKL